MKIGRYARISTVLALAGIGAGAGAGTASGQPAPHEQFICTFGSEQRLVSIYRGASGDDAASSACRVDYTKQGATKTLWTSNKDYAYCVAKAVALVTTLTDGHYSCKPETVEPPKAGSVE
jgi:hypothetical protein